MTTKKPKKRNPQDKTSRNINPLKRRLDDLEKRMDWVDALLKSKGYYDTKEIQKQTPEKQKGRRS